MKRIWDAMARKQTTIGSAAIILVSMVFASRVLGLVRDRLLSARFGPDELGVYFAAFRLPNLIFELLVTGALTSAFIPVFTKYITQGKEAEGWRMASILINISVGLLVCLSIPIFIWTESVARFFAPGFSKDQILQMSQFTRIMIASQVLPLLVGNFFTGILQSYTLFIIPAIAPVIYNAGIILGIVLFTPVYGLFAPVIGVGLGAILFMTIQIPLLLKIGYRHNASVDYTNEGVKEVGRLIGPRAFGLAVSQIDTTVDLMLSTLLGARMVTIFNFAQHLQQLPVGLFGASIAQAALPMLSKASIQEDMGNFKESIISAMHQILFFVLPSSVFFIVLRIPVVRLVFGASRFDWEATVLTGITLSLFSLSLCAQSLVHVFARGFYALYDTKTPVLISIISISINTVLSIFFIQYQQLPVWSLGLSTSIASMFNASALYFVLAKRIRVLNTLEVWSSPIKMLFASIMSGLAVYIPLKLFDELVFDTSRTFGLLLLTICASVTGLFVYIAISWLFDIGEVHSFFALLRRVGKAAPVWLIPANEVVNDRDHDSVT